MITVELFSIGDRVRILATGTIGRVVGFHLDRSKRPQVLVDHADADCPEVEYFDEPYDAEELGLA